MFCANHHWNGERFCSGHGLRIPSSDLLEPTLHTKQDLFALKLFIHLIRNKYLFHANKSFFLYANTNLGLVSFVEISHDPPPTNVLSDHLKSTKISTTRGISGGKGNSTHLVQGETFLPLSAF